MNNKSKYWLDEEVDSSVYAELLKQWIQLMLQWWGAWTAPCHCEFVKIAVYITSKYKYSKWIGHPSLIRDWDAGHSSSVIIQFYTNIKSSL